MSTFGTSDQTPRVVGKQLEQYVGQKVRLVGSVMGPQNDDVALKSPDGMAITVVSRPSSQYQSKVVEVVGVVKSRDTIEEVEFSNFGDSLGKRLRWISLLFFLFFFGARARRRLLFLISRAMDLRVADMDTYCKMCELANGEYRALFL